MKRYILLFLLFLGISAGCTKELNVDFGEPSKKIVLYPFLTNNKKITIKMSGPAGILATSFPVLENATVVITDNDVPVDTITINAKGNGYSKIIPVQGHEYGFKATANGYPEAVCTAWLPKPVEFLSVDTALLTFQYSFKHLRARLIFKDDPNTINFFKATIYRKVFVTTTIYKREGAIYLPHDTSYTYLKKPRILANNQVIDFFSIETGGFLLAQEPIAFADGSDFRYELGSETYFGGKEYYFSDDLFNGKELIIDFIAEENNTSTFPEKYMIELSAISKDYYWGLKSYARYGTRENANLPASEEVSIYSAVKGGYGFPIAFTSKIDSSFWMQHY